MEATPKTRKSLFDGLTRILHLHQLPRTPNESDMVIEGNPWKNQTIASSAILQPRAPIAPISAPLATPTTPIPPVSPPKTSTPITPTPIKSTPIPNTPIITKPITPAPAARATEPVASNPMVLVSRIAIVTDYDRIYELVKVKQSIKLDEVARVLGLKEERVAQELQTLEDNGMVDVRYPAFGEPLIVYKKPEA